MTENYSYLDNLVYVSCPSCKGGGEIIYFDVIDRVIHNEGKWNVFKCFNDKCRTFYISPRPKDEDLYRLYLNYPTHDVVLPINKNYIGDKTSFLGEIKHSYIARKFGYGEVGPVYKILSYLPSFLPAWSDVLDSLVMNTRYKKDGTFLDVGCGGGGALALMKSHGWSVQGIDFDKTVIEKVATDGYSVLAGALEAHKFDSDKFDALLMSHVIEHVPDPLLTLTECVRVLKKEGALIIYTPNSESFGSLVFGSSWRGLESPDHLQIFNTDSLKSLALLAGFSQINITTSTSGSKYMWNASLHILRRGRSLDQRYFKNSLFLFSLPFIWHLYGVLIFLFRKRGEVIVCECIK